jgi:hypothetical protein
VIKLTCIVLFHVQHEPYSLHHVNKKV